uniref:DGCR13 n=1 Tax=Pongo pygmaeus TaxID=9600 RepID=A7UAV5_PONPY|nr:DGCR13 [Pongo pygmaeus]
MVFGPGGLGQPVLHPVLILRHHQQPVLGFGSKLVVRLVVRPRAWLGVQFALSAILALPFPLEGGPSHGFGLGGAAATSG